jgi:hypothetical protein
MYTGTATITPSYIDLRATCPDGSRQVECAGRAFARGDDVGADATVFSLTGQANAIGQAGGGPVLGAIGNVWGIRAALATGALAIGPALGLYARAIAHHGREPELEELPLPAAVD